MVLREFGAPLVMEERPEPMPQAGQVRVRVEACAVCRTDLHLVDDELEGAVLPRVPGHEIVGRVDALGEGVSTLTMGQRVGVPWLGWTCGECRYCRSGRENLCEKARFTGHTIDGGFATSAVADARYCFPLESEAPAETLAPLLCAGLIGYRSLRMCGDAERIGIWGFGAAAHIITQVARWQEREIWAFTRPGDESAQAFARKLGAVWAGGSDEAPKTELDASILFAPIGALVPAALRWTAKGGVVVCGGIHMSDIPAFPYSLLWGERVVRSVANLTRKDGEELLALAPKVPVVTETTSYPLERANDALEDLRNGRFEGAAVLVPS